MSEKINKPAPVAFYELVDAGDSGFFLEGTEGTRDEIQIRYPEARTILNTGFRKKVITQADGTEVEGLEEIRYIKNCPIISVEEQEKRNIKPHAHKNEDWILFKKGELCVSKEGSFIGLYDFMEAVSGNISNPDRIATADEIFRVMRAVEDAEDFLDLDELKEKAIAKVRSWKEKIGGQWAFKESTIDAACEAFGVQGDTYPIKWRILFERADARPDEFLKKIEWTEQTSVAEINNAIQLKVIEFTGNMAMYVSKEGDKMIYSVGTGNLKLETKVTKLSDWFRTKDGDPAYQIFKSELDKAKEEHLAKQ